MNITLTMALKQLKYLVEDILFSNNNEIKNAITSNFHNYKKLEKLYINGSLPKSMGRKNEI